MAHARWMLACATLGVVALAGCHSAPARDGAATAVATSGVASCHAGGAPSFGGSRTAYDTPAAVQTGKAVSAQVGRPSITHYPSGRDGYVVVRVPIGVQVRTNGVFAINPASFVLANGAGHTCVRPRADPLPKAFAALQVDESHPGVGAVAFLVPQGADLSKYTVYYTNTPGSSKAAAAWSASGSAPTLPARHSCDGGKSRFTAAKARHASFGHPQTFGDKTVSLRLTAYAPTARSLKPSDKQPNDVDGVAIRVRATAKGALEFIGRAQFRLVDGAGDLCRYNPLGSDGENLTSALVKPGATKSYTLIFWIPKGAKVTGWKLLYLGNPKSGKVTGYWD